MEIFHTLFVWHKRASIQSSFKNIFEHLELFGVFLFYAWKVFFYIVSKCVMNKQVEEKIEKYNIFSQWNE